jgi:hypothetical protein
MNPPAEFQKRATDCMQMARLLRDPESKAHVEPDGSEVASLRRNLRGPKPSGARSVPETSTAVPTWLGSALEAENNRPVAGLASRCARARGS